MADLSYHHGVKVVESPDTPSLLRVAQQGVTFVNGTAPEADAAQFPLNTPKLVTSLAGAALLGESWLQDAVSTIFNEGGTYVIVNRVEDSETEATLNGNLIGDPTARTGIYAALRAKDLTGYRPRVIITQGDTGTYIEDGVMSVALGSQGSNMTEAPTVTASGGGSDPAKVLPTLEAVMGEGADSGKVVSVRVVTPGRNLTQAPTIAFTGGGSDEDKVLPTATANVGDAANQFISALNTVAHAIAARAYVSGPNTTDAEAVRWRKTINSGRILPIDPLGIKNVDGSPVPVPMVPVFAGVRARVVASAEGVSGSVSNKLIRTLDGAARTVTYPADSNFLNDNQVATVINERGGFRTWGSRLAIDDEVWQFDSVRATADMVNEIAVDVYFNWVDRKMLRGNLKLMVEDGNAALRALKYNGDILNGKFWLTEMNQPTLNANGRVFLGVDFEPVGLMEQIDITAHRNIRYYIELFEGLVGEFAFRDAA